MTRPAALNHQALVERLANAGSWTLDLCTREMTWSEQVFVILGLDQTSATCRPADYRRLVHPDDIARVEATFRQGIDSGDGFAFDCRIVRPDGRIRTLHVLGEMKRQPDSPAIQYVGALQDVTELRAAQTATDRSQQMLVTMLQISPEAVVVTDTASRILAFSAGAQAVFGYTAAEVIGRSVELLMPERFRGRHRTHVETFSEGARPSLRMHERSEITGLRKNGEEFPAEASLAKLETPVGYTFATIIRDLSGQRAAERELIIAKEAAEQAAQAKSTFLANMSHEIRTPLNGVIGVAGSLARTDLSSRQSEMVQLIEDSARALEHLLTEILDLAKIDAGRNELAVASFNLAKTLNSVFDLFEEANDAPDVTYIRDISDSVSGTFIGDEFKIRQILNNILSNARKFTRQGSITFSASATPVSETHSRVRIDIADTGIGFPQDKAQQLFDRFEQADNSITRQFGGTGLGLAITKSLVELMGGAISASSIDHLGATFTVELELERVAPPLRDPQEPGPEVEELETQLPRVLLAEDHPMNRMVVQWILDEIPVALSCVENGQEAVRAAELHPYDLILMDMQMPVMDGLSAIRQIRLQEDARHGPRTPICVLTANSGEAVRRAADEAGADGFLTKPINAGDLIALVLSSCAEAERSGAV